MSDTGTELFQNIFSGIHITIMLTTTFRTQIPSSAIPFGLESALRRSSTCRHVSSHARRAGHHAYGALGWLVHLDGDIQMPSAAGDFAEISGTEFIVGQFVAVPQRQWFAETGEKDLAVAVAQCGCLERNPAQTATTTAGHAPAQFDFPALLASSVKASLLCRRRQCKRRYRRR